MHAHAHRCTRARAHLGRAEAPLASVVNHRQILQGLLELGELGCRTVNLELLQLGHIRMKTSAFIRMEDCTDVRNMLQQLLRTWVALAAVSPAVVLSKSEGVMDTVLLVRELCIIALPDLLELGSIL